MYHYKPCVKCGWANYNALRLAISPEEKEAQAYVYNTKAFLQSRSTPITNSKSKVAVAPASKKDAKKTK